MTEKRSLVDPDQCTRDMMDFQLQTDDLIDDIDNYLKDYVVPEHVVPSFIQGVKLLRRARTCMEVAVAASRCPHPADAK